ncbi:hemerythrin domain-containing protein [Desulfocurvibacter africanus]|uniref:hemerythrin domain-containing protein n=1 Tax=Desulfocurvibacter africanus TaxID=873 RepID=UPI0003FBDAAE|nr:hemerythrin domain-containing protein [Desulfocurvibacter africanus]
MKATQELRNEHEGIQLMLKVLTILARKASSGEPFDRGQAGKIIEFLRVFADKCHHGKEEDVLFPELEKAGIARQGGPIGVMLHEHVSGREFIRRMSEALPARNDKEFAEAATGYIALLSAHIQKENEVLFVMADKVLPAEKQEEMFRSFERIEEERIGPGVHESFHKLMDDLAAQYLAASPGSGA